MNVGASFVAHAQSAVLVHPAQGPFDDPPCRAEAAAVDHASHWNQRSNATRPQPACIGLAAIAGIALHAVGAPPRLSTPAAHARNRVDESWQECAVVAVGSADQCGQRNPAGIRDEIVFGA